MVSIWIYLTKDGKPIRSREDNHICGAYLTKEDAKKSVLNKASYRDEYKLVKFVPG